MYLYLGTRNCLPFASTCFFLWGPCCSSFSFYVLRFLFVCLRSNSCAKCYPCLWNVYSVFSNVYKSVTLTLEEIELLLTKQFSTQIPNHVSISSYVYIVPMTILSVLSCTLSQKCIHKLLISYIASSSTNWVWALAVVTIQSIFICKLFLWRFYQFSPPHWHSDGPGLYIVSATILSALTCTFFQSLFYQPHLYIIAVTIISVQFKVVHYPSKECTNSNLAPVTMLASLTCTLLQ